MKMKHHTEYTSETLRAIAYKRELKIKKRKETIAGILVLGFLFVAIGITGNNDLEILAAQGKINVESEPMEIETETISENAENEFYIICDVDEAELLDNGETVLAVIMQNGNLHYYEVIDAPEGYISEVCFKTNDLNNYTTYEVVALR